MTASKIPSKDTVNLPQASECIVQAGIPARRQKNGPPSLVEDGEYPHQYCAPGSSHAYALSLDTDITIHATSSPQTTKGITLGTTQSMQKVRSRGPGEALLCSQM